MLPLTREAVAVRPRRSKMAARCGHVHQDRLLDGLVRVPYADKEPLTSFLGSFTVSSSSRVALFT